MSGCATVGIVPESQCLTRRYYISPHRTANREDLIRLIHGGAAVGISCRSTLNEDPARRRDIQLLVLAADEPGNERVQDEAQTAPPTQQFQDGLDTQCSTTQRKLIECGRSTKIIPPAVRVHCENTTLTEQISHTGYTRMCLLC